MDKLSAVKKLEKIYEDSEEEIEALKKRLRFLFDSYVNDLEESLADDPELLKELRASARDQLEKMLHRYEAMKQVVQEETMGAIDRILYDQRVSA